MRKKATNLSLSDGIKEWGRKICETKNYASLSVLVEELIREEYARIFGSSEYPPRRDQTAFSEEKPTPSSKKPSKAASLILDELKNRKNPPPELNSPQ